MNDYDYVQLVFLLLLEIIIIVIRALIISSISDRLQLFLQGKLSFLFCHCCSVKFQLATFQFLFHSQCNNKKINNNCVI